VHSWHYSENTFRKFFDFDFLFFLGEILDFLATSESCDYLGVLVRSRLSL
jgi:hypothetical protein